MPGDTGRCLRCGAEFPAAKAGGRGGKPRLYCSEQCKTAAKNARYREKSAKKDALPLAKSD